MIFDSESVIDMANMNPWAVAALIHYVFYGILVIFIDIKKWSIIDKPIKYKISEILYGVAYILNGILLLYIFNGLGLSEQKINTYYLIIFLSNLSISLFFWGNGIYTMLRIRKDPSLLDPSAKLCRNFDLYMAKLELEYKENKTKDRKKDFTRKLLHFIQFGTIVLLHELLPLSRRNLTLEVIAGLFIFMFSVGDILRITEFKYLPDWALIWYSTSMELKEKYTYNSALPFLLAMLLYILAPIQVLLSAAVVACIADAMASIIGKAYGNHKMINFGRYPQKSFEGLIAGAITAFIGIVLVFHFYPIENLSLIAQMGFAILGTFIFVYNDVFSQYVVDNILNALLTGMTIWVILYFLI